MTHSKALVGALGVLFFPATVLLAQAPPPPPPGAPPPPAYGASPSSVVTARITQFLINPNGDVDGLLLGDNTQVNFPPHLSPSLLQIARVGDSVSIQGFRGYGGTVIHATAITNTSTNRTMVDQPPSPDRAPPTPGALAPMSATARVSRLLHADMGELNGVTLEDGTVVRFPPAYGAQLQTLLQPNLQLTVSGYGTQTAYGRALEATSIAVEGKVPVAISGPGPAPQGPAGAPPPR